MIKAVVLTTDRNSDRNLLYNTDETTLSSAYESVAHNTNKKFA